MSMLSFRADADLLERVDAARGSASRSSFMRDAVLMALTASDPHVVPKPAPKPKPSPQPVKAPQTAKSDAPIPEVPADGKAVVSARPASKTKPGFWDDLRPHWSEDCEAVISEVRVRRHTEMSLSRALGWPGLRCQNAVNRLFGAGVLEVNGGLLEVVDG